MKVFISYGKPEEQVTALRLQSLAAVSGITAYVPPVKNRLAETGKLSEPVKKKLRKSDVVFQITRYMMEDASGVEVQKAKQMRIPVFDRCLIPYVTKNPTIDTLMQLNCQKFDDPDLKAILALCFTAQGLILLSDLEK